MKDLASHIMDIVQNSIRANATIIEIELEENCEKDWLKLIIRDNGDGMDDETVQKVTDPFFTSRTVRKVGLGVPLLKQNAERCGGKFEIKSEIKKGTTVTAGFIRSHIDCLPSGNIGETIMLLIAANPETQFIFKYITPNGVYIFDAEEIKEILDGVPLQEPEILNSLKEMINSNIEDIKEEKNASKSN